MSDSYNRLGAGLHRIVLLSVGAVVLGCEDVTSWSEDVAMRDGKVIKLERRATKGSSGFPMAHRGMVKSWELCYAPLKVYWKSNYFQPSHFELDGDKPYVKFPLRDCSSCKIASLPDDSTVYMAYRGREWVRIGAAEYPSKRWRNLMTSGIFGIERRLDVEGHVTLAEKEKRDVEGQAYPEESKRGQFQMKEDTGFCRSCAHPVDTDLKFDIESKPTGSFCR